MNLNSIIRRALELSNTTYRAAAAEIGLSPQNFSQRLRRDGFSLEEAAAICDFCGAELGVTLTYGDVCDNIKI